MHAWILQAVATSSLHPYLLPIGPTGEVSVRAGRIVETRTGKETSVQAIVKQSREVRFLLVGESHDSAAHHEFQADIINAFAASGRDVVVGMEMFTRPAQPSLLEWSLGWQSESEFIEKSQWKAEWGFDFALYRPVFEAVKRHRLPLVALNVPRDWVRRVGRAGLGALTPEERAELPADINLQHKDHRSVFEALMGGHPVSGQRMEFMYSAQVLWDVGMADSAKKALQRRNAAQSIVIILAGNGHVLYGQGINRRLVEMGETAVRSIVQIESDYDQKVARGIADYVHRPAK